MDANTGQICAALMTHQAVGDAEVLPELLGQIAPDTSLGVVSGDGAYDARACYAHHTRARRAARDSTTRRRSALVQRYSRRVAAQKMREISLF
jgi:hypothetical protein